LRRARCPQAHHRSAAGAGSPPPEASTPGAPARWWCRSAAASRPSWPATSTAVRPKGLAEAEAIAKRADALEKEADAVIGQQIAEKLPEIVAAAAESFKHVDNLTVLNGAQGISEIIAQVIGQAGPALKMAQEALGRTNGAQSAETLTGPEEQR
jgi:flotillin